jgi:hypothetical protein
MKRMSKMVLVGSYATTSSVQDVKIYDGVAILSAGILRCTLRRGVRSEEPDAEG